MNKLRRMLSLAFGTLFLVCVMLFAASCLEGKKKYSLTAEYDATQGTVCVNGNAITANTAKSYEEGAEIKLTVTPNEGYSIDEVTVDGTAVTLTENGYTFELEKDTKVAVTFEADEADDTAGGEEATGVRVSLVNDAELGDVTLTGEALEEGTYKEGSRMTVSVKAREGYSATLTVNGEEVELDENGNADIELTEETEITVNYSWIYSILPYYNTEEGTVILDLPEEGDKYAYGEEVNVTVTPHEHYQIGKVLLNGEEVELDEDGSFVVEVTGRMYVVVEFIKEYSVTVEESVGGTITLDLEGDYVLDGEEVTFTVAANPGYVLDAVFVNGALTRPNAEGVYTVKVTRDTVIKANFLAQYSIDVTTNGDTMGSWSLSAEGPYVEGTKVRLTVKANTHYYIKSVTVGGEDVTDKLVGGMYIITVDGQIAVEIEFANVEYTVAVTQNNLTYGEVALLDEDGEPATAEGFINGTQLTVTVEPTDGYMVDYIRINGVTYDFNDSYTFTVEGNTTVYVHFTEKPRTALTVETTVTVGENEWDGVGENPIEVVTDTKFGDGKYYLGQKITVSGGVGYKLTAVTVNGEDIGELDVVTNSYTFSVNEAALESGKLVIAVEVEEITQNITFVYDNGDEDNTVQARYFSEYTIGADPTYEGYRFLGWKMDDEDELLHEGDSFKVLEDVTLTAQWQKVWVLEVENNDKLGTVTYSEAPSYENSYDDETTLYIDITPKAGYRVKTIALYYADYDEPMVYECAFDHDAIKFDETITVDFLADVRVVIEYVKIHTVEIAEYDEDILTVTYQIGEKIGTLEYTHLGANRTLTVDEGTEFVIYFEPKTGYRIIGVNVTYWGEILPMPNDSNEVSYSIPVWAEDYEFDFVPTHIAVEYVAYYTVSYDLGEHPAAGEKTPEAQYVDVGDDMTIALPAAPAAEDGYRFDGWYVGDEKLSGETYTVSSNVTITAKWVQIFNLEIVNNDMGTVSNWEGGDIKDVYDDGDTLVLSVEPKAGYRVTAINVYTDGEFNELLSLTFGPDPKSVQPSHTVTVDFYYNVRIEVEYVKVFTVEIAEYDTEAVQLSYSYDGFDWTDFAADTIYVDADAIIFINVTLISENHRIVSTTTHLASGEALYVVENVVNKDDAASLIVLADEENEMVVTRIEIETVKVYTVTVTVENGSLADGRYALVTIGEDEFTIDETTSYVVDEGSTIVVEFHATADYKIKATMPIFGLGTITPSNLPEDATYSTDWHYTCTLSDLKSDGSIEGAYEAYYRTVTVDEGNGTTYAEQVQNYHEFELPENPTRAGFVFRGWLVGEETHNAGDKITVTEDITITAKWMKVWTVTVKYGNGDDDLVTVVDDGTDYDLPEEPKYAGYRFDGWEVDGELNPVTSDVTITAKWVKIWTVTVKYGNGDDDLVIVVDDGTDYDLPEDPKYAGHRFDGWDVDGELNPVTSDVTITAKWVEVFTVTYNLGDYAVETEDYPKTEIVDKDTIIHLPAAPAAQENYYFVGWQVNGDPVEAKQPGEEYTVTGAVTFTARYWAYGKVVVNVNDLAGGTISFRGDVQPDKTEKSEDGRTITYYFNIIPSDLNGILWTITVQPHIEAAEGYKITEVTISGSSYDMMNGTQSGVWDEMGSGDVGDNVQLILGPVNNGTVVDITFTKEHTVTVDYNDEVTENEEVKVLDGETFELPEDPTREGYKFVAWHFDSLEGEVVSADFEVTSDVKLVAEWIELVNVTVDTTEQHAEGGSADISVDNDPDHEGSWYDQNEGLTLTVTVYSGYGLISVFMGDTDITEEVKSTLVVENGISTYTYHFDADNITFTVTFGKKLTTDNLNDNQQDWYLVQKNNENQLDYPWEFYNSTQTGAYKDEEGHTVNGIARLLIFDITSKEIEDIRAYDFSNEPVFASKDLDGWENWADIESVIDKAWREIPASERPLTCTYAFAIQMIPSAPKAEMGYLPSDLIYPTDRTLEDGTEYGMTRTYSHDESELTAPNDIQFGFAGNNYVTFVRRSGSLGGNGSIFTKGVTHIELIFWLKNTPEVTYTAYMYNENGSVALYDAEMTEESRRDVHAINNAYMESGAFNKWVIDYYGIEGFDFRVRDLVNDDAWMFKTIAKADGEAYIHDGVSDPLTFSPDYLDKGQTFTLDVTGYEAEQGEVKVDAEAPEYVAENGYRKYSIITLTVKANNGYKVGTVTVGGKEVELTEEGTYTFVLTANTTVTVTFEEVVPEYPTFPDDVPETEAPEAGEWKAAGDSESILEISDEYVKINGEFVTDIKTDGKGGDVVYTLTTETAAYTLKWFGGIEGYILVLEEVNAIGARYAIRPYSVGDVSYFVNPNLEGAKLLEAELETLVGTWQADGKEDIVISGEVDGLIEVVYGSSADLVIRVGEGSHFFVVIGSEVYDLTLEGDALLLGDLSYEHPVEKKVTMINNNSFAKDGEDKVVLTFYITTTGYTEDDLRGATLVIGSEEIGKATVQSNSGFTPEGSSVLFFNVAVAKTVGTHALMLIMDGNSIPLIIQVGYGAGATPTVDGLKYSLVGKTNEQLYLKIEDVSAPETYTVTLTVNGNDDNLAGTVTLVYGETTINPGATEVAPVLGQALKLNVTVNENYSVVITVIGSDEKTEGGEYEFELTGDITIIVAFEWVEPKFHEEIGKPDYSMGYTPDPVYTDKVKKGEVISFIGTIKTDKTDNWNNTTMFLYSDSVWGNFRLDRWINGLDTAVEGGTKDEWDLPAEGWHIAKYISPEFRDYAGVIKSANVLFFVDYTQDNLILVGAKMVGDNGLVEVMVYSIVATAGNTLKDEYTVGFGTDGNYTVLTERKVGDTSLDLPYNELNEGDTIKLGNGNNNTANNYDFSNYIAKGDKLVFSGTHTATGNVNWDAIRVTIGEDPVSPLWFRADNWVEHSDDPGNENSPYARYGWNINKLMVFGGGVGWDTIVDNKPVPGVDTNFRDLLKDCNVTVTLDWTVETEIKVILEFVDKNDATKTATQTYVITSTTEDGLKDSYNFTLGHCFATADLTATEVSRGGSSQPEVPVDPVEIPLTRVWFHNDAYVSFEMDPDDFALVKDIATIKVNGTVARINLLYPAGFQLEVGAANYETDLRIEWYSDSEGTQPIAYAIYTAPVLEDYIVTLDVVNEDNVAGNTATLTPASEDGKYQENTVITLKVTVADGYTYTLEIDNVPQSLVESNEYTITVRGNTTVKVTFKAVGGETEPKGTAEFAGSDLFVYNDTGLRFALIVTPHDFSADALSDVSLRVGDVDARLESGSLTDGQLSFLNFVIEDLSVFQATGSFKIVLTIGGVPFNRASAGTGPNNDRVIDGYKYSLNVDFPNDEFTLIVTQEGGEVEPPKPEDKKLVFAGSAFDKDGSDLVIIININEGETKAYYTVEELTDLAAFVIVVNGQEFGADTYRGGATPHYFTLKGLSLADGTYTVALKFDGKTYDCPAVAGNHIDIDNTSYDLSISDSKLWLTIKTEGGEVNPPQPEDPDAIKSGDEAGSIANQDWEYWFEGCTVDSVKFVNRESGVNINAKFTATQDHSYGFQLFYNNYTDYTENKLYTLTFTIVSTVDVTITVNKEEYKLTANVPHEISVTRENSPAKTGNAWEGKSLFSMQVVLVNGRSYELTLSNISFEEYTKPVPTYVATDATLEEKDGEVYFVISGTSENYSKEDLETLLKEGRLDLQNNPDAPGHAAGGWDVFTGFETIISVDENGNWTVKFNVTVNVYVTSNNAQVKWGVGAYVAHIGNTLSGNGDIKIESVPDGTITIELGGYVYTIYNGYGHTSDESDYFWGCIGLSITEVGHVEKSGKIDYSTIDLVEEDGVAYLIISGTHENCIESDFVFDVEGSGVIVLASLVDLSVAGKFTLKVNLTDVPAAVQYYMHLKIAASNGNGNVANNDTDYGPYKTLKVGTKTYTIEKKNISWGPCVWCLQVEDATAPGMTYDKAELRTDDEHVWVVFTVSALANCDESDLETLVYAGSDSNLIWNIEIGKVVPLGDGAYELHFDVTNVPTEAHCGKWWRAHLTMNGEYLDDPYCTTVNTGTIRFGAYSYELSNENNAGRPFIVVNPIEKKVDYNDAELVKEGDEVYLKLTITTAGYTKAQLLAAYIYHDEKLAPALVAEKSTVKTNDASILYFNITGLEHSDSWYWLHLALGADYTGAVNIVSITEGTVEIPGKQFTLLLHDHGTWQQAVIAIEDVEPETYTVALAEYNQDAAEITVEPKGEGIVVGTTVTITIELNAAYEIVSVKSNGNDAEFVGNEGNIYTYTCEVNGDVVITVEFRLKATDTNYVLQRKDNSGVVKTPGVWAYTTPNADIVPTYARYEEGVISFSLADTATSGNYQLRYQPVLENATEGMKYVVVLTLKVDSAATIVVKRDNNSASNGGNGKTITVTGDMVGADLVVIAEVALSLDESGENARPLYIKVNGTDPAAPITLTVKDISFTAGALSTLPFGGKADTCKDEAIGKWHYMIDSASSYVLAGINPVEVGDMLIMTLGNTETGKNYQLRTQPFSVGTEYTATMKVLLTAPGTVTIGRDQTTLGVAKVGAEDVGKFLTVTYTGMTAKDDPFNIVVTPNTYGTPIALKVKDVEFTQKVKVPVNLSVTGADENAATLDSEVYYEGDIVTLKVSLAEGYIVTVTKDTVLLTEYEEQDGYYVYTFEIAEGTEKIDLEVVFTAVQQLDSSILNGQIRGNDNKYSINLISDKLDDDFYAIFNDKVDGVVVSAENVTDYLEILVEIVVDGEVEPAYTIVAPFVREGYFFPALMRAWEQEYFKNGGEDRVTKTFVVYLTAQMKDTALSSYFTSSERIEVTKTATGSSVDCRSYTFYIENVIPQKGASLDAGKIQGEDNFFNAEAWYGFDNGTEMPENQDGTLAFTSASRFNLLYVPAGDGYVHLGDNATWANGGAAANAGLYNEHYLYTFTISANGQFDLELFGTEGSNASSRAYGGWFFNFNERTITLRIRNASNQGSVLTWATAKINPEGFFHWGDTKSLTDGSKHEISFEVWRPTHDEYMVVMYVDGHRVNFTIDGGRTPGYVLIENGNIHLTDATAPFGQRFSVVPQSGVTVNIHALNILDVEEVKQEKAFVTVKVESGYEEYVTVETQPDKNGLYNIGETFKFTVQLPSEGYSATVKWNGDVLEAKNTDGLTLYFETFELSADSTLEIAFAQKDVKKEIQLTYEKEIFSKSTRETGAIEYALVQNNDSTTATWAAQFSTLVPDYSITKASQLADYFELYVEFVSAEDNSVLYSATLPCKQYSLALHDIYLKWTRERYDSGNTDKTPVKFNVQMTMKIKEKVGTTNNDNKLLEYFTDSETMVLGTQTYTYDESLLHLVKENYVSANSNGNLLFLRVFRGATNDNSSVRGRILLDGGIKYVEVKFWLPDETEDQAKTLYIFNEGGKCVLYANPDQKGSSLSVGDTNNSYISPTNNSFINWFANSDTYGLSLDKTNPIYNWSFKTKAVSDGTLYLEDGDYSDVWVYTYLK